MKCPKCGSTQLKVNEKRDLPAESAIRRRRECVSCSFRFTTYERVEIPLLMVLKKTGVTEPYLREKLAAGFYKSFEKRPLSPADIEAAIDEVEREIMSRGEEEIKAEEIGDLVTSKLKTLDDIAYLRFVSVYKSFDDVEAFEKELNQVKCGKDKC